MFTVKHQERGGYECVRNARTVDFRPQRPDTDGGDYATVVAYDVPGTEGVLKFTSGRIYVMNDQGRTVSDYDLDAQNKNKLSLRSDS